jgi:HlyD family secretion protein
MMNMTVPSEDPGEPAKRPAWWRRQSRAVMVALRVALVLLLVAAAAWWFLLAPVAVTTHTAAIGAVSAEVLGTGTLEARHAAVIGPKLGGLITHLPIDEGARVRAGDLLFQLEDSDIRQQVAMAESDVAAARATLARLQAGQRRAEAVLLQARTHHERTVELLARNSAALVDKDMAVEALAIAEAELASAGAAIIEGQKGLISAEHSLEYQRARLRDTSVEAPFDGLVVRRDREPGDVVAAGASVLRLVSLREMWVSAWVDETELSRLADGQPARVVFRSEPDTEYVGTVARVGREADRETRELVVDVRVETLPARWAVGQRAEVYILTQRRDSVLALPSGLLRVKDGKPGVLLDLDGAARWREVTVGLRGSEFVEVQQGLAAGDVVVSPAGAGTAPLREGRRIKHP